MVKAFLRARAGVVLGLIGIMVTTAATGCAAPDEESSSASADTLTHRSDKMVGGTVSSAEQDAAVMVALQQGSCTGTLIAPNLVLTARHCVAEPGGNGSCATFGPTTAASNIRIFLGANATGQGTPAARGSKITVPTTASMCSFDVALVQLDKPLTNAKIAKPRFTPLAANEPTIAVGYGVGGNDEQRPARMQRSTTVLGVGSKQMQYRTKQNQNVSYNLPDGDVATGESTCYGDSGGPLFDAQGNVVAVTSRGLDQFPQSGAHGNGCVDLPSLYAGVKFNEQLIRSALQAAGHPIPIEEAPAPPKDEPSDEADDEPTPDDDEVDTQSSDDEDDEASDSDDEEDSSSDDEDEEEPAPKKKKKKTAPVQASACSMSMSMGAPVGAGSNAMFAALGLGLVVLAARRRRN